MKDQSTIRPDRSTKEVYREVLSDAVDTHRGSYDDEELGAVLPGFDAVRSPCNVNERESDHHFLKTVPRSVLQACGRRQLMGWTSY